MGLIDSNLTKRPVLRGMIELTKMVASIETNVALVKTVTIQITG